MVQLLSVIPIKVSVSDYEAPGAAQPHSGAMWSAGVFFLTQIVVCQFTTGKSCVLFCDSCGHAGKDKWLHPIIYGHIQMKFYYHEVEGRRLKWSYSSINDLYNCTFTTSDGKAKFNL